MIDAIRKFCRGRKLFLSYASEDRRHAEEIAQALILDGNQVFFDHRSLKASDHYGERIRDAIRKADAFIYLVTRSSLREGSFTLTELRFAQEQWPSPAGRIFPVLIDNQVSIEQLPVYLRAVHILRPEGNVSAEVAAVFHHTVRSRPRCWAIASASLALIAAAGIWIWTIFTPSQSVDVVLQPIEKIHFRPLSQPPADTAEPNAQTEWSLSPVTITLMPVAYNHRTEPGRNVRVLGETIDLTVGTRNFPYNWAYIVEISPKQCSDWLCVVRSAGPETLEPGRASNPRETMFLPSGTETISWREFFDYIMTAPSPRMAVTLKVRLDLPSGARSNEEMREVVCGIDVNRARRAFSSRGFGPGGKVSPPFMQSACILSSGTDEIGTRTSSQPTN